MSPPVSQVELVGFDHVDLVVKNRAKAQRFFVEQLGLDVLGEGPSHTFLILGNQVLGLHDPAPNSTFGGIDHLALRVSDWTGLRNRIKRARIVVTGEKERGGSRSLYLRGPDGLGLELVWRPDPDRMECSMPPRPPPAPAEDGADEPPVAPPPRRRRR
jgi:catechol-2,3-dioxygenase